ncbi:hypothetical protein INR49_016589 [Caranx melampygus]|nr:hypothetical protein INR49_016589 [Caranx melampygus]
MTASWELLIGCGSLSHKVVKSQDFSLFHWSAGPVQHLKLDGGETSGAEGPAFVLRHRTSNLIEHTTDSTPTDPMSPREKGDTSTSGSSTSHLSTAECPSHNGSVPECDKERRIKEEDDRGREGGGERDQDEDERSSDEGFMGMTPLLQAHHAMERMEEFVHKVSLGCLFFLCLGLMYMFRPNMSFVAPVQEKVVIGMFFLGAILCLSFSWLFHTVYCHSEGVSRVFSKLDYSGIAFLIMGSFVPWLYYSFYCSPQPCFIYLIVVCILGLAAITVSQCDFFATPQYRGVRAGVFVGLGLSGVVPTLHFVISEGLIKATTIGQMGWLLLMAMLYITGACLYAARIPERFFPGKCDIWFHSHQLFHILVVAGAFVHFHGVSNLQEFRYTAGAGCAEDGTL